MSNVPQYPAGWYPDPQNAAVVRWWDGYRWTEAWHPAPGAAPAPPAPQAPAEPAAQQAPAYSAPVYEDSAETVRRDIPTNTVWIWLVVLLPLASVATTFLFDWSGLIEDVVSTSMQPGVASQSWMLSWTTSSLLITLLGYVVVAAQVVFAFLDWRILRARGVVQPFHWAWIFFAVVITNGVYVIGRGVVLRRRTGSGLAPVWAWIAVTVLGWIIGIIFVVVMFNGVFAALAREGLLTP